MTDFLVQATHLKKSFGENHAVDGVDLDIASGEIYGLVGADGAGKTTTLRLLVGALRPDEGQASVCGYDLLKQTEQARSQTGYLSQRFSLYEDLTVLENIRFFAEVRGLTQKEWLPRCMDILEFVGLADFKDRRAGQLSGGMKQKLGLASALVTRPRVLLLDEPTTGVDPVTRQDFWQLVIKLVSREGSQVDTYTGKQAITYTGRQVNTEHAPYPPGAQRSGRTISSPSEAERTQHEGVSVIITTPYMDEAARCHRVGFMKSGRIIAEGTPGDLRATLSGRILELRGQPLNLLRHLAAEDEDVEDVQAFGDRLHLRLRQESTGRVLKRLPQRIKSGGGTVSDLRQVPPVLEDVFIALTE